MDHTVRWPSTCHQISYLRRKRNLACPVAGEKKPKKQRNWRNIKKPSRIKMRQIWSKSCRINCFISSRHFAIKGSSARNRKIYSNTIIPLDSSTATVPPIGPGLHTRTTSTSKNVLTWWLIEVLVMKYVVYGLTTINKLYQWFYNRS